MVVQNRPQTIDIEDCSGVRQLPAIFNGISNTSIDTVRIRRSGIQALHIEVFVPIASTLRDLDLSHNSLRTVPQAIGVLWSLEHLNLQHNSIVFLKPTGVFDGLPMLRELNLAHNYIGQAKDVTDDFTQQHGYQLKGNRIYFHYKILIDFKTPPFKFKIETKLPVRILTENPYSIEYGFIYVLCYS